MWGEKERQTDKIAAEEEQSERASPLQGGYHKRD